MTVLYHHIFWRRKTGDFTKIIILWTKWKKSKDFIKSSINLSITILGQLLVGKKEKWKTLFKIKDENLYPACKIYYGECEHCRDNYIEETVRNTVTQWSGHNNPDYKSEPAEHIKRNIDHVFNWKVLCPAPSQKHLRKNLEAIFIAIYQLSLND